MGNIAYGDLYCQERDYAKWLVPSALSTWLIIKIDDVAYLHYKPYPELSCLMWSSCLGNQNQLLHLPANLKLHITQGTIPELLPLVVRLSVHWWPCFTFNLGCLLLLLWSGGRSGPICTWKSSLVVKPLAGYQALSHLTEHAFLNKGWRWQRKINWFIKSVFPSYSGLSIFWVSPLATCP